MHIYMFCIGMFHNVSEESEENDVAGKTTTAIGGKIMHVLNLFICGCAFLAHLSQRLIGELIGWP